MELYDVINESFDFRTSNAINDIKNLKLLALHVFDVKDFAFSPIIDEHSECMGHRVLLPIETSGNIAQFTFNATFTPTVEPVFINKSLKNNESYLLFMKMISSCKEVMHHCKELDLMRILVDVHNTT